MLPFLLPVLCAVVRIRPDGPVAGAAPSRRTRRRCGRRGSDPRAPRSALTRCSRTTTSTPFASSATSCTWSPSSILAITSCTRRVRALARRSRRGARAASRAGGRGAAARPQRGAPTADDDRGAGVRRVHAVRRLDHDRLEEVHVADEVGDEGRRRPVVDRERLVELLDAAVRHHGDAVGHRHGLLLVVRHVDEA